MTKIFFAAATLLAILFTSKVFAQDCGGPVRVLSVYTTIDKQSSFSFGAEFGAMREDSPWGYFGGVILTLKKPHEQDLRKEPANALETIYPTDLTIYMKGTFQVVHGGRASILGLTSAEIDIKSRFDVKPGLRFLIPVGDRVAFTAEPLYSVRNQNVTGRVGLSIAF